MAMLHRNCGGTILMDRSRVYEWEQFNDDVEPPIFEKHCEFALVCSRCNTEVLGDAEIFLEGFDEVEIETDSAVREAILPSVY